MTNLNEQFDRKYILDMRITAIFIYTIFYTISQISVFNFKLSIEQN